MLFSLNFQLKIVIIHCALSIVFKFYFTLMKLLSEEEVISLGGKKIEVDIIEEGNEQSERKREGEPIETNEEKRVEIVEF